MNIPDVYLGGDMKDIYCPVCGERIGVETEAYCDHVLFVYLDMIGEFIWSANPPQSQRIEDDEELETPDEKIKALLKEINSDSVLCVSFTTSGMACGPMSSTVYMAFDFCT